MKTCAYCGRNNQLDATHCEECGTEFAISARPSQPAIGKANRTLIFAACVVLVLIFSGILTPWRAARQDWLALTFVGFTNYAGQRAGAFTVTNCSVRTLSLTALVETQAGYRRPIYPDPTPYEPKPSAGALLPDLTMYPSASPYQLKAGHALTFITAVPGDGTPWRVTVHYVETLTPWQVRQLKCAQFFWKRGELSRLGDLIWRRGHPKAGTVYGPELRLTPN